MNPWTLVIGAWAGSAVAQLLLWLIQLRTRNAGIVDLGWTVLTGGSAVAFAVAGDGDPARRALLGAIAGLWAVRLAAHLTVRIAREPEDGRYADLRARFGAGANRWFLVFFQVQAGFVAVLSVPFALAATNVSEIGPVAAGTSVTLAAVALVGELVADAQLARHRRDPDRRGKACREGLWRYSRHPNYFFEWVHWFAYVPLAWGAPLGWLSLSGPILMLLLITKVTGIPPTESRALRSRGDDYRAYQRETNAFFPWFPRRTDGGAP
jgi:steroid 5-alpha reductase family enzyme